MWWLIDVDPDHIRRTGSLVYLEGQAIGVETQTLRTATSVADAYGSDPITATLAEFSTKMLPKTLTYFEEVGQAALNELLSPDQGNSLPRVTAPTMVIRASTAPPPSA